VRRLRAGGGVDQGAAFLERLGFAPEGSGALVRDLSPPAQ
jgi:hypothetical protein